MRRHDDSIPDEKRPVIQRTHVHLENLEAVVKYTLISALRFIISKVDHELKLLWGPLARSGKGATYGKSFRQNGAVVVKMQASHNFPHDTFEPIALLALGNKSRWKMKTTGPWFKFAKNFIG